MTRAPGYEVAADEDPPLAGHQKLADFAARHARLSSAQVGQADGYMWIGSVLYPNSIAHHDFDVEFSWERELPNEQNGDPNFEKEVKQVEVKEEESKEEGLQASRRYTGGQARRIRKERERNTTKRASRRLRKKAPPMRKPENDIPDGDS